MTPGQVRPGKGRRIGRQQEVEQIDTDDDGYPHPGCEQRDGMQLIFPMAETINMDSGKINGNR